MRLGSSVLTCLALYEPKYVARFFANIELDNRDIGMLKFWSMVQISQPGDAIDIRSNPVISGTVIVRIARSPFVVTDLWSSPRVIFDSMRGPFLIPLSSNTYPILSNTSIIIISNSRAALFSNPRLAPSLYRFLACFWRNHYRRGPKWVDVVLWSTHSCAASGEENASDAKRSLSRGGPPVSSLMRESLSSSQSG